MKTICVIFGTRPEAIKLAPVVLALRKRRTIRCRVCVTGQHRHMLDQALTDFGITPDTDLKLMRPGQTLAALTARTIARLDDYLAKECPDLVLVQGDTTTTLCGALAAFYRQIPIAHIEAGLRTRDLSAPWPEEGNRAMVSRLATLHFAPTEESRQNLRREGIEQDSVHVTGNTVIDSVKLMLRSLPAATQNGPDRVGDGLQVARRQRIVLVTAHRRENFGKGLDAICAAIRDLAGRFPQVHFVYPVHLNPRIRGPVLSSLGGINNVRLLPPLPYLSFLALLKRSYLLVTDSGGLQEEAPVLHKPVLVMRDRSERMEAVRAGVARLVGTSRTTIVRETTRLLLDRRAYEAMVRAPNPFGDGKASGRIARICLAFLNRAP